MKIINVVGTRPNFMKIAPILEQIKTVKKFESLLLHTGQHYDEAMSENFFKDLNIPKPDIYLEVGSDTQAKQVAKIMERFDDVCDIHKPDAILVVGDVNSTMACTLVAQKRGIKTIHVEAGIRSGDKGMPEEINRMVTDSICDYLLPPSQDAVENLLREGKTPEQIKLVGNIMIDTLLNFQPRIDESKIIDKLNLRKKNYVALTLHRPSNVDNKETFLKIFTALEEIQKSLPVVFPVHPRTKKMISGFGLDDRIKSLKNLILTEPMGYFDFGNLVKNAKFVLTDSGGIQEETTVYKIPCITLRENTERPITIWEGTNEIAGSNTEKIIEYSKKILDGRWKEGKVPDYWDGKTAERIVGFLANLKSQ